MRIALTALTPRGPADVIVSGDDGATAGQVAEALAEAFVPKEHLASVIMHPSAAAAGARLAARGPVLWARRAAGSPDTPAARALRDGAVVTTLEGASTATSLAEPGGVAELRVIGGPNAGTVHRLGPGVTTLGSGPGCQVRLASPGVPAHAATVTVAWGLSVPSLDPAGPALLLDGKPVTQACAWPFGGVLRDLHHGAAADAARGSRRAPVARRSGLAYHRPPRFRPDLQPVKIAIPAEPKKGHGNGMTMLLSALIPMAMGGVMVYVTRQWLYSLFMLMFPLMVLAQWLGGSKQRGGSQRRQGARVHRPDGRGGNQAGAGPDGRREEAPRGRHGPGAGAAHRDRAPAAALGSAAVDDPDALRMRVALSDGPAMIQLIPAAKDVKPPAVPTSFCVPVSMSLAKLGVGRPGRPGGRVPVAGPVDGGPGRGPAQPARPVHRGAGRRPRRGPALELGALAAALRAARRRGLRRARRRRPGLGGQAGDRAGRRGHRAAGEDSRRAGAGPRRRRPGRAGGEQRPGPKIIVVLDGARQLRRIPGMPQLLANARRTGVYAVCIDEAARVLPEECAAVLSWDIPGEGNGNHHGVRVGPGGWTVASHGAAPSPVRPFLIRGHGGPFGQGGPAMLANQVSVGWADRVARALAPVRDVSRDDADAAIPDSARLLDLIHMPDPHPDLVLMAWQKRGRTTKIPIGVSADGPFELDLRRDGPHRLVAGTTGSGKSELLQTVIASLAVGNRPDPISFVLVDYKGGAAFKACAHLPHTVGWSAISTLTSPSAR